MTMRKSPPDKLAYIVEEAETTPLETTFPELLPSAAPSMLPIIGSFHGYTVRARYTEPYPDHLLTTVHCPKETLVAYRLDPMLREQPFMDRHRRDEIMNAMRGWGRRVAASHAKTHLTSNDSEILQWMMEC